MANDLFAEFDSKCKKIDTCAGLLEDLEHNLKNETKKAIDELRDAVINDTDQDVIDKIGKLNDLKKDWIQYRDTCTKIKETLATSPLVS